MEEGGAHKKFPDLLSGYSGVWVWVWVCGFGCSSIPSLVGGSLGCCCTQGKLGSGFKPGPLVAQFQNRPVGCCPLGVVFFLLLLTTYYLLPTTHDLPT